MEIIHVHQQKSPFSLSLSTRATRNDQVLQPMERNLLAEMENALTIIHGGEFKRRRPLSA